jgi:hypothetical protein
MNRVRWLLAALLALSLLSLARAEEAASDIGPQRVEMKLDRCVLLWRAHHGLDVEYDGARVFSANPDELVIHSRDWNQAFYKSSADAGLARLTREGTLQVLKIDHTRPEMCWSEIITAGPGDRFRVEYAYVQNAWDDVSLQLGFSRPVERWFAGAPFQVDAAVKRADGLIPKEFDSSRPNPFDGARTMAICPAFGRIEIEATKPVSLFDYADRRGHFWLGFDEPLPKDREGSFAIEVRLSPAAVTCAGVSLLDLRLPAEVDNGRLAVTAKVRSTADGPQQLTAALMATSPTREQLGAKTEVALAADRLVPVALSLPVPAAGEYTYQLVLTAEPEGKQLYATRELSAKVEPAMTVLPGRSLYTSEETGCLLVTVAASLANETLRFSATADNGFQVEADVRGGIRSRVPFEVSKLPQGKTRLTCQLKRGGETVSVADVWLRKEPPKPNEVKIDYESRGLIVDGLPCFPFGFYCIFPGNVVAGTEAPHGFNMIAAYQNANRDPTQIRAYFDRCARVGMKVHYDIRTIAQAEPSPAKWEALKREVEMLRDHPALLAWYLCDEPDGQGIPPARLVEAYNFIKDLDPYHPITMVFCIPDRAAEYVDAMDIMMADPYPIPNGPVTTVSDWADQLNQVVNFGMPLWIVPQAFGGGELWAREPSAREERAMTYLALVHGATGIQYFIRRPSIGNPISPSLWSECRRLALEAQELTPVLLSAEAAPIASADTDQVHVTTRRCDGSVYVMAVNTHREPAAMAISVDGEYTCDAEVLFEGRKVAVSHGKLKDVIDGFGTRVYRIPIETPREAVAVSPSNLTVNPSFEDAANAGTPDGCYVTAGKDAGASLFVDSRAAYHGSHSLRLRTPIEGMGVTVRPFPIELKQGRTYDVSVWAKGLTPGLRFRLGLDGIATDPQTFTMGTEWAKCVLTGVAKKDGRGQIYLELVSAGVAWFDLLQVTPR